MIALTDVKQIMIEGRGVLNRGTIVDHNYDGSAHLAFLYF